MRDVIAELRTWLRSLRLLALVGAILACAFTDALGLTFYPKDLWPGGSILKVCFYNGTTEERKFIADAAPEWTRGTSLFFDFGGIPDPRICDGSEFIPIRILITETESWSFIGQDSIVAAPRDGPTMKLSISGQLTRSPQWVRRAVLHEFGHALGFQHEELNPQLGCARLLDLAQLNREFGISDVSLLLGVPSRDGRPPLSTRADAASIMMFPLPPTFYFDSSSDCARAVAADHLSEIDRQGVVQAYPDRSSILTAVIGPGGLPSSANLVSQSQLRPLLDERLEFTVNVLALVNDPTLILPPVPQATDFDSKMIGILTRLSTEASTRILAQATGPLSTLSADYRAGKYREAYVAAQAVRNDAGAELLIANMHLSGLGRPFDLDAGLRWVRAAADHGSIDGRSLLAFAYQYGLGTVRSAADASAFYQKAQSAGDPFALHMLGVMYFGGREVQQDYTTAAEFFRRAAAKGFSPSRRALAVMYDQALGTPRDPEKAFTFAKEAADDGDTASFLLLGLFYADGTGTMPDSSIGVQWLKKAADSGFSLAAALLGFIYDTGALGQPTSDRAKAVQFYNAAQNLGSGRIAHRLGELLETGDVSERARAAAAVQQAAELGYVPAQIKLAEFYRDGFGAARDDTSRTSSAGDGTPSVIEFPIPKNPIKALAWYTIASLYAGGTDKNTANREHRSLARILKRADWIEATELITAWVRRRDGLASKETTSSAPIGAIVKPIDLTREVPKGYGSGVVISLSGSILTNYHVIEGCTRVRATVGGETQLVKVSRSSQKADLAVLQMPYLPGIFPAKFRTAAIRLQIAVLVMGFPQPDILGTQTLKTQDGHVTALAGPGDDSTLFQMSATINPGNSGGPVFDSNGNIIGIAQSRVKPEVAQNINYAIKSDAARMFLETMSVQYQSGTTELEYTPENLAQSTADVVAMIECFGPPAQLTSTH